MQLLPVLQVEQGLDPCCEEWGLALLPTWELFVLSLAHERPFPSGHGLQK